MRPWWLAPWTLLVRLEWWRWWWIVLNVVVSHMFSSLWMSGCSEMANFNTYFYSNPHQLLWIVSMWMGVLSQEKMVTLLCWMHQTGSIWYTSSWTPPVSQVYKNGKQVFWASPTNQPISQSANQPISQPPTTNYQPPTTNHQPPTTNQSNHSTSSFNKVEVWHFRL